jgi:hypothetical protein
MIKLIMAILVLGSIFVTCGSAIDNGAFGSDSNSGFGHHDNNWNKKGHDNWGHNDWLSPGGSHYGSAYYWDWYYTPAYTYTYYPTYYYTTPTYYYGWNVDPWRGNVYGYW